MISLLFNVAVYGAALLAGDMVRRRLAPISQSATYQRQRWHELAIERGLVATGTPNEYTGTWQDLTVVLSTRFVRGRTLVLGIRVLGLFEPSAAARALAADPALHAWTNLVRDGELHGHVHFTGNTLTPEHVDRWLQAVAATPLAPSSVYRGMA